MKPLLATWRRLQAMAWLVCGRRERALAVFDAMLADLPDGVAEAAYPLASRAHLQAQLGRREAALADYRRLVSLPGANAAAWFNLGYLLDEEGQLEDALAAFSRATELDPRLDRAWYGQGLVLIRLQRLDEAVQALRRNTELQPMSPYGWYQLARVHVDRQQPEEAAKIIRHLQGFEPKVAAQLQRETGLLGGPAGS